MNNYQKVIYGNYAKSSYPEKLAKLLADRYFKPQDEIVELGCGDGTYVKLFHKLGYKTWGRDAEIFYINGIAIPDKRVDFNDGLPYISEQFDIIFAKSVLEHISKTEFFLSEVNRILRPGGKAIFLLPSWEFNYRWFYDDPTHVKPFHRKGLQDALKLAGFKNVKVEYFYHLPFMWKHPKIGGVIAKMVRLLPDDWRWKDWEQQKMNVLIRFAKEVQLLAIAEKG